MTHGFGTQFLDRLHQHLPITQLEVATLAFTIVNILIWSLWWAKPFGVYRPIVVGSAEDLEEAEPTIPTLHFMNTFDGVLTGRYSPYLPVSSTSVPTFWSMDYGKADRDENIIPFYIGCLVGTIFSVVHCAAWNTNFPSTIKKWMWRVCSLLVATIPAVFGLVGPLGISAQGAAIEDTLHTILGILVFVSTPLYPITRLFLITISSTSLRALLPGVLIGVSISRTFSYALPSISFEYTSWTVWVLE
ncbi:hypothetical protein C8R44DRAFT_895779 [Mycena epipterygia]|nr:hypothetical protein C8R44DRAFT_895779 [Mycena epipterygia]